MIEPSDETTRHRLTSTSDESTSFQPELAARLGLSQLTLSQAVRDGIIQMSKIRCNIPPRSRLGQQVGDGDSIKP